MRVENCRGWYLVVGLLVAGGVSNPAAAQDGRAAAQVAADVRFLASDALEGRFTGSLGADRAATYLARRFAAVGAKPGVPGWRQAFPIAPDAPALAPIPPERRPAAGANVVAIVPGTDRALRDEAVVVGAHYDHLGRGALGAMDPAAGDLIRNGADDNASGAAALLEIARRLAARPPRRSVVIVAFAGEELGLLGSAAYVKAPVISIERTVAMINLDMVGRLRNDRLLVFGSETAREFPALLDTLNQVAHFDLHYSGDGFGRSDQQSFFLAKRPVLHLFTDLHEDYHRATDDADKINGPGLARVAAFAADLVRILADRVAPLTFVDRAPPVEAAGVARTGGYGAYLGTVPDMSGGGPGVRLSGVRPSSPADQAGLRADDVLLRIGRFLVTDLHAMTDALRGHQPGDTTMVVYRRGGVMDSVRVVLGRRGGS